MTSLETSHPAASEARVAETAHSLREMAAVVRVLFGVGLQRAATSTPEPLQAPVAPPAPQPVAEAQPHDVPASQPAALSSVPLPEAIPVEGIALPTEPPRSVPAPTPAASAGRPGAPAAIPVPGLAPQPAHESAYQPEPQPDHDLEPERHSLAMLNEIAFLDD